MSKVYGRITLDVLVDCENESEAMALMEANYKINKDLMIHWKLQGIDSNNQAHEINVCDCTKVNLNEFIG